MSDEIKCPHCSYVYAASRPHCPDCGERVRHLTSTIEMFRSDKGKRAKPTTTFQLQVFRDHAVLQGPRGKTVQSWAGTPEQTREMCKLYVSAIPGATYNSFHND